MMKRMLCTICALLMLGGATAETSLIDQWDALARVPGEDGLYLVCRNEKWGMVNREGEILVEPELRHEPKFENGYAVVAVADAFALRGGSEPDEYGSFYGVISTAGEWILPAEYDSISISGNSGTILVEKNQKFGYADMEGEFFIQPEYDRAHEFTGDYAAVAKNYDRTDDRDSLPYATSWGMIDRSGRLVVPLDYDWLETGETGPALAQLNGKYGYVNAENEIVVDFKYWSAQPFVNGYAAVGIMEFPPGTSGDDIKDAVCSWGLIDESGREVIPCRYGGLTVCENGLLLAEESYGRYFYISTDGKPINNEIYYRAQPFVGDYAAVGRQGELPEGTSSASYTVLWGAIDSEGKEILPMEFDSIKILPDGTIQTALRNVCESYTVQDGKAVKTEA